MSDPLRYYVNLARFKLAGSFPGQEQLSLPTGNMRSQSRLQSVLMGTELHKIQYGVFCATVASIIC